jgi:hypothetical protein
MSTPVKAAIPHGGPFILSFALLASFLACEAPVVTPAPSVQWKRVATGLIQTEGVVIESMESRQPFTLVSGKVFTNPIASDASIQESPSLIQEWKAQVAKGDGTRIKITYHGQVKYGVLALNQVPAHWNTPGSRSYLIQFQESSWAEASNGNISVVFERANPGSATAPFPAPNHSPSVDAQIEKYYHSPWLGWVLWISDRPFS